MYGVIRIDMSLTDNHIYQILEELLPHREGKLTYDQIASKAGCHKNTVINSTKRLTSAGRIATEGGKGREPVKYKLCDVQ